MRLLAGAVFRAAIGRASGRDVAMRLLAGAVFRAAIGRASGREVAIRLKTLSFKQSTVHSPQSTVHLFFVQVQGVEIAIITPSATIAPLHIHNHLAVFCLLQGLLNISD